MGIRESVTWGGGHTVSGVVNLRKIYRNTYVHNGIGNLGGGHTVSEVVNLGKIYRNTYGNKGIGNLGGRTYGIWGGEFGENL